MHGSLIATSDPRVSVSVILPVRNRASSIADLVQTVRTVKLEGVLIELLVINHGSFELTRDLGDTFTEYIDIYQQSHQARAVAVRNAIAQAFGEVIVVLDIDGGYTLDDYPSVVAPILAGEADVVFSFEGRDCDSRHKTSPWKGHTAFRIEVLDDTKLWEPPDSAIKWRCELSERRWRVCEVGVRHSSIPESSL